MEFAEYQPLALRTLSTAVPKDSRLDNLDHAVLGLCTEVIELEIPITRIADALADESIKEKPVFDKVNFMEEVGDVWWYVAVFVEYFTDGELLVLAGQPESFVEVKAQLKAQYAAEMAKNYSDGYLPEIGSLEWLVYVERVLHTLRTHIGALTDQFKRLKFYKKEPDFGNVQTLLSEVVANLLYLEVMAEGCGDPRELNIAKLRKRYPEKFTIDNALNRDIETELSVFKE